MLLRIFYSILLIFFQTSQLIKNLEAEREELLKDLKIAESKTNEKKDLSKTITLENLIENIGIMDIFRTLCI